jgi:hypothetical protein
MLWQVAMSVVVLQGPLHVPFAQVQLTGRVFERQEDSVTSAAQSNPRVGVATHPGVAEHPGMF